jgi:hypothetical protein
VTVDFWALRDHPAAQLVAQDVRRTDHVATERSVLEVVHVRAADPHRGDLDQDLPPAWFGDLALLDLRVPRGVQHRRGFPLGHGHRSTK